MIEKIASWARLVRDVCGALIALHHLIVMIIEIVNKAANCDDRKLQNQVRISRKVDLCPQ
ncbi:MAG: hypothetical protein QM576_02990 [Rhodopseudomonas sp.]|uniref:hypothetical protein n=1 Tax=Rhodopseudomonas sp. TaxID=1078 RepID=UPI0039E5A3B0